jgi:hypothetical protein
VAKFSVLKLRRTPPAPMRATTRHDTVPERVGPDNAGRAFLPRRLGGHPKRIDVVFALEVGNRDVHILGRRPIGRRHQLSILLKHSPPLRAAVNWAGVVVARAAPRAATARAELSL